MSIGKDKNEGFYKQMNKIQKYMTVIDTSKEFEIRFSDILRPLVEHLKQLQNFDVGSMENKSQISGLSGITGISKLVNQIDFKVKIKSISP
jgi:hypothetical protein